MDGSTEFKPEAGRYHLYVSYACPWAHRTLITRKLKGLENIISFDVVNPLLPRTGWSFETSFPGSTGDRVNGFPILRDVYLTSNSQFNCAVTVPVLWDRESSRIVDYPNIWGFTRDVYQLPGVAETVNMAHIKSHYFESHTHINPFGIVPDGPLLNFDDPHGRG